MINILIDGGYWAWNKAYSRQPEPWRDLDKLIEQGACIAMDSASSVRKSHIPWYKAQRKAANDLDPSLKERAIDLCKRIHKRYNKESVLYLEGYEADDVIALHVTDCDIVLCNDKDYLTLHSDCSLKDLKFNDWGIEKWQKKAPNNVTLRRGNSFLTYQLLYGDVADNIPRLLDSKDRRSGPFVLGSDNPLETAITLLPDVKRTRESLLALMLPCPLLFEGRDIIDIALERHPV